MSKTSVENKIIVGFVIALLALAGFGWLSYRTATRLTATNDWVDNTYQVIVALELNLATLTDVETAQRAYLLTGDARFLEDYRRAKLRLNSRLTTIRQLTADDPKQQQRLNQLEPLMSRQLTLLDDQIQLRQEYGLQTAANAVTERSSKDLMDRIWQNVSDMRNAEDQLLGPREQAARRRAEKSFYVMLAGGGLASVIGLMALLAIRRELKLRNRTEEKLRLTEERTRLMIESIRDYAIIMLDPKGGVVSWNEGAERTFGYTAQEIVGRHFAVFYSPEMIQTGFPEKELAEATTKGHFENEGWRVRKDGSQFWANTVVTAIRDETGLLRGFSKVVRDLTERRDVEEKLRINEEKFRALADTASDAIISADVRGNIIYFNPGAERMFGFPAKDVLGKSVAMLIPECFHDERRKWTECFSLTGESQAADTSVELIGKGIAGNEFPVELSMASWKAGEEVFFTAIIRDIAERKQREAQIQKLNMELQRRADQFEAANKELEAFSYSVSHDLRSPLRHIDGFVKLLDKDADKKLDDHQRRYLDIIADSAQRMGALIDDLLVFSRMGRMEIRQTKVAPESLVHEAVKDLQGETEGRHINWKIGALPEVQADPAMLRQVWANLIGNAVKYTRPRDPAEIEIGCADSSNGEYVFFVRDNGVGFDMQYAHKLFGVFQRLHRAEEFEGTGIGLANVNRIVHRHGGRTWAEGKVDAGATFFFSLPKTA